MFLRRFSLRTRFLLVMLIAGFSLLALGAWGVIANNVGIRKVEALFDQANASSAAVAGLRESVAELRRLQANIVAAGSNVNEVERLAGLWKQSLAAVREQGAAVVAAVPGDESLSALVKQQDEQLAAYSGAIGPIIDKLKSAQIDASAALAYAEREEDKAAALAQGGDAILKTAKAAQAEIRERMAETSTFVSNLRLALVGLTIALVMPLLWFTWVSIRGPLDDAVQLAGRIAQGDLSSGPEVRGNDETAALLRSLLAMQDSLRALVSQVRGAAESIHVASSEVAVGNQDLSQRTEQTAGSLQAAASSIEQLHGAVSQSAESARQANSLASGASEVAARGGEVVSQVVSTMQRINEGSRRIADIIGTIDGIAFQTNILALNAAVEAARAGEQGRGFAVVAGEVRSLAQRSAQAAREIKSLIGDSVERVESGSQLVHQAGGTMDEIVQSVQRVTAIIGEITTAASEQRDGIGQVNGSVAELDRATQQNAALVEQSAAAAESLKQQASALTALVATFRLA
jgi:methyl-accepting chemotaxis protein